MKMREFDVTVHVFVQADSPEEAVREVIEELNYLSQCDNYIAGAEILDGDIIEVIEDEATQRKMV